MNVESVKHHIHLINWSLLILAFKILFQQQCMLQNEINKHNNNNQKEGKKKERNQLKESGN